MVFQPLALNALEGLWRKGCGLIGRPINGGIDR